MPAGFAQLINAPTLRKSGANRRSFTKRRMVLIAQQTAPKKSFLKDNKLYSCANLCQLKILISKK